MREVRGEVVGSGCRRWGAVVVAASESERGWVWKRKRGRKKEKKKKNGKKEKGEREEGRERESEWGRLEMGFGRKKIKKTKK